MHAVAEKIQLASMNLHERELAGMTEDDGSLGWIRAKRIRWLQKKKRTTQANDFGPIRKGVCARRGSRMISRESLFSFMAASQAQRDWSNNMAQASCSIRISLSFFITHLNRAKREVIQKEHYQKKREQHRRSISDHKERSLHASRL